MQASLFLFTLISYPQLTQLNGNYAVVRYRILLMFLYLLGM